MILLQLSFQDCAPHFFFILDIMTNLGNWSLCHTGVRFPLNVGSLNV